MPTPQGQGHQPSRQERLRAANVRTAFVLFTIALVFFFGILFARYMGDGDSGMTVLGVAVLLFLGLAIGRNLIKGRNS